MPKLPAIVSTSNRIVITVGKKVFVVQVSFCCQNIGRICVDKSAGLRVIVAVLEVIQPCVRIKIVPTIAEGVQVRDVLCTGNLLSVSVLHRQRIAPAVIDIPRTQAAVSGIQGFRTVRAEKLACTNFHHEYAPRKHYNICNNSLETFLKTHDYVTIFILKRRYLSGGKIR